MFGVLIAATDPVAIIAMFKDNGVHGRVRLLVESESLFNDGVAAVLFVLVLAWAQAAGIPTVLCSVGSAHAHRLAAGDRGRVGQRLAAILVARRTSDHLVEAALTTVVAYGSFLLAEYFACVRRAGHGRRRPRHGQFWPAGGPKASPLSVQGREFGGGLLGVRSVSCELRVFLLIGLNGGGHAVVNSGLAFSAAIIALVLVGRALTVYPLCALFRSSRMGGAVGRTACAVVGRPARRAGAGVGLGAAAGHAAATAISWSRRSAWWSSPSWCRA